MKKYVIMGPQGCGKGTQAKLLKDKFDLTHINVGEIFRWHVQSHTKIGARVKRIVASGRLVDDELVEEIVRWRLEQHDWNYGFVLDGFPRNAAQALFFLESYDVDAVIYIDISDEIVHQRVLSRRLCSECGLDYNLISHRPAVENRCDVCGGELVRRPDDTPEALAERLSNYHEKTSPTLELFRNKELVVTVNGDAAADAIHADICSRLGP